MSAVFYRSTLAAGKAVVLGAVLGGIVAWGVLILSGWHFFVMTTPSMSPLLPVHSLVVTAPVVRLHVGEIAAFRPPGYSQTFVHKIVGVTPSGYRTQGVLNSTPDPWTVPFHDVLGREVRVVPVLGFLVQTIPVWIGVAVVAWGLSHLLDRRYRVGTIALAAALCVEIPLAIWRPLVGMDIVTVIAKGGKARAFVVGTGLLPERFRLGIGRGVVVPPGHAAVLSSPMVGHLGVGYQAALPWWGWAVLVLASCLPLWIALWATFPLSSRLTQQAARSLVARRRPDLVDRSHVAAGCHPAIRAP